LIIKITETREAAMKENNQLELEFPRVNGKKGAIKDGLTLFL